MKKTPFEELKTLFEKTVQEKGPHEHTYRYAFAHPDTMHYDNWPQLNDAMAATGIEVKPSHASRIGEVAFLAPAGEGAGHWMWIDLATFKHIDTLIVGRPMSVECLADFGAKNDEAE